MEDSKEVSQIPIEDIIPNRFQPRINFDEKALNELAESIKQHGIIQPLVLRPLGDKFEIIAGERRYKAATMAGLSTVPVIVTEMDDNTSAEVALIENVQRKDLSSIEEAKSYKSMLERSNMTQEELAKKMGLSQSTIANKLRLLNLADEVQNALSQEKISERHARALLSINNKEDQVRWLERIINERLTVRQLDLAIKDELNQDNDIEEDIPKVNINPDIESIINNAVDINPAAHTPVESTATDNILNSSPEEPEVNKTPNKFFNYLEDEEVNMSMKEESKPVVQNAVPTEDFNFTPEFTNAPENTFAPEVEEEIESLDVEPTSETPVVQESVETVDEPIFKEESIVDENNNLVENTVEETTPVVQDPVVTTAEAPAPVAEETPDKVSDEITISEAIDNIETAPENNDVEEFIFDDEDSQETQTVTEKPNPTETKAAPEAPERELIIEPIPVIEEDGVVDPVTYYDTLDPDFVDRVKEIIGLDLKNAINSYRELTDLLESKGFNISIDETDLDNKYKIEINIDKE